MGARGYLHCAAALGAGTLVALALGRVAHGQSAAPPPSAGAARLQAMNIPFEPERFVQFAGQGDAAVVEAFLDAGMPPDSREPRRGSTALIHAAAGGHARIVARLLDAGAALARTDDDGTTALAAASYFGKVAVVEALLAHGADARVVPEDVAEPTALDAAIWGGDLRIVKMLVAAGADAIGARRETPPLVRTAYTGRLEILGVLLEARPPQAVLRRAREAARAARHAAAEALLAKALAP